jgi:TonB-dependent receptor
MTIWVPKWNGIILTSSLALIAATPVVAQTHDLFEGMVTPSLRVVPRELRELLIYEEPWLARTPSPVFWRAEYDERDQRRRAADVLAIQQAELSKRRIGGIVDVPLRSDDEMAAEHFDLKSYFSHFSTRDDEMSWQSRLRFRIDIPDQDAGIMFYYRHRERKDRAESEHTKWAGAQNMPDGPDTAFINEHELRSSPENEIMDEVGAVLRWNFNPGTRLLLGGTYRQQEDHLIEQRLEFDTRAGTAELPGQPPRRGYPYNPATDTVSHGIVTDATLTPGVGRIERQLKDEIENKERWAAFIDFTHEYADNSWLKVQGDYAKRTNREPDRRDTEFSNRPDADWSYSLEGNRPIFELTPIPDSAYSNRKVELENNLKERDYAYLQALAHHQVAPGHIVEAGTFAMRHRDLRDINYQRYEPVSALPGNTFDAVGSGGLTDSVLGQSGWSATDPGLARDFFDNNRDFFRLMEAESFFKNLGEDYNMEREITGGHVLYRHDIDSRWRFHAGARFESAHTSGTAYDAQWTGVEPAGRPVRVHAAVRETSMSRRENDILPTVLAEYQPQRGMHFSASLSQTLQRPELRESAPFSYYHEDDGVGPRASLGNPDLESSRNTRLILTGNHAFAPGSFLRLRLEAWHLEQPITSTGWFASHTLDNPAITAPRNPRNYRFEQSINADSGELFRFGLHHVQVFHFLPHPFDQMGAFSFLDFTHSSQKTEVNGNARSTPVTYQPDVRGGAGLFFRNSKWQASLFADVHSKYLISVGEKSEGLSGTGDHWVDDRITLNANFSYQIQPGLEVYSEISNLTDSYIRMYEGTDARQVLREKTGREIRVGLHWEF